MSIDDAAAELYGLDPGEFVSTRTERAAQARADGDRELAAAITALRKPTVAAWTVNLLARDAPAEIAALLDLGDALRAAQRQLSGTELRALGTQRQQVVNAMTKRAAELSAEHGRTATEQTLREVGQTLTAALADPEVADQIRTGVLPATVTYEGFGPAGLVAITGGKGRTESGRSKAGSKAAARPEKPTGEEIAAVRRAEARQELDDAEAGLESARADRDEAESSAAEAKSALAAADDRVAQLRADLEHAEQQRHVAQTAEHRARGELTAARSQFDRMRRWADRARARLDES
ncbi:hypothetical protein [Nocardia sp. NPDC004415]